MTLTWSPWPYINQLKILTTEVNQTLYQSNCLNMYISLQKFSRNFENKGGIECHLTYPLFSLLITKKLLLSKSLSWRFISISLKQDPPSHLKFQSCSRIIFYWSKEVVNFRIKIFLKSFNKCFFTCLFKLFSWGIWQVRSFY